MNRCKICGQPCGIYEICRECQKDIEDGKVSFCNRCQKYYFSNKPHKCFNNYERENYYNDEYEDFDNPNYENQNHNSKEKSTFRKAAEGTAGVGCGVGIILAAVVVLGIIALAFLIDARF